MMHVLHCIAMELIVERGKTAPFDSLPPKSIALDGYVAGPFIDTAQERYSFDHHGACIRHVTSATCVQVLDAVLLGFNPEGFSVFINDVDADTILSVMLLREPKRAESPQVQLLVHAVGKIDAHGPTYPLPPEQEDLVEEYLEVVLEPERRLRREGAYSTCDLRALLDECIERTTAFIDAGFPRQERKPAQPYRVVISEGDMALIEGDRAMMSLAYKDGWNKLIGMLPVRDGSRAFTIAKRSEFTPFDVPRVLRALADREPGWGGGSTVGGAPRNADGSRSRLTPQEVWDIALRNG